MKRNNSKGKKKAVQVSYTGRKKTPAEKTTSKKDQAENNTSKRSNATELRPHEKNKPMPVVGIGSSAGGLEAFSKFLENLPANLGMAYVYVQHLSPDHQSLLPEILERKTNMPVMKTEQDMRIEKDHVYVIPANKIITVSDGMLKLMPRPNRENFYPIDSFFISLAHAYQQNAIGILLSGTGTDGTLGLKALKAEGGITFAQDDTARYHDMPSHASEMGYVDFIMPPDKIALQLSQFFDHDMAALREPNEILDNDTDMRKIETIMHTRRNVDFSHYKKTTIHRRILRRMVLHRLKTLGEYARLLKENSTEVNALYQDLLISVTNFFRDQGIYETTAKKILPDLFKERKTSDTLRIWIPGCATGEEAISMAITILEYIGEKAIHTPIQIFATDLNEKAVERARTGIYLKSALENVSPERLEKFFTKINGQYQVIKAIREMIIYAPHNLLNDPPFSRMDIVSCQNVLIYLETNPQNKIMHAFHYALKPTGYLILGKSESIGPASDLFEQLNKSHKIYRRKNISTPSHLDFLTRPFIPVTSKPEPQKVTEPIKEIDLEKETEKVLLKRFMPASVLVNKDLEILRFRGSVSKYLEPATGKASLHLMKMVKEELAYELRTVINEAKKEARPAKKRGLHFNGDAKEITIEVIPVKANSKDNYFLIIFQPENGEPPEPEKNTIVSKATKNNQIASLQKQLKEAKEHMKIISEEFEATREELQSAHEEVLSSNEELQSINEELETSKEELQSTNEELTTINEELQTRNVELQESYEYVESIFETIHEPLLVLSEDLRIKDANKVFYKTFNISPEETEGNYLFNINDHEWDIPELKRQLKLVQLKNLEFTDFEIRYTFKSVGEKAFLLNAQKLFIKDKKNVLILLAIEDITEHRLSEQRLKESAERFRLLIENAFDIITVLSKEGIIMYESESVSKILGYSQSERVGKSIFVDSITHPEDIGTKRDAIQKPCVHAEKL